MRPDFTAVLETGGPPLDGFRVLQGTAQTGEGLEAGGRVRDDLGAVGHSLLHQVSLGRAQVRACMRGL